MALGKGLSALIPDKPQDEDKKGQGASAQGATQELSVSQIKDNRFQPRQNYDDARLDELVASIKEQGFLQPIVVRPIEGGFEVVAGERRLKAARKLKLEKVPVLIKEATDKETLVLALVENVQREELNAIEKAESYRRLIEEFGYKQENVASAVGKDRATIANLLRLLKLPEEIRQAVIDGKISEGHARTLVSVDDPNTQKVLFLELLHKGLSVRELEARVKGGGSAAAQKKTQSHPAIKDPEVMALEEELQRIFGTKVAVANKRGNKGKVVIEYYSLDDLDRILGVVRQPKD